TATITTDDTLTVYASGYDAGTNYIGLVDVTWSQTGTLSPAPSGTSQSFAFDPDVPGSGTIDADHATATDDSTGTITVNLGAESYIGITTTLGGSNAIAGSSFDIMLTVYDGDDNVKTDFTGAHNVDWTVSGANNAPDSTVPTLPSDGNMTFALGVVTYSNAVLVNGTDSVEIKAELTVEGVNEDTPLVVDCDPGTADHFTVETENSGVETAGIDFEVTVTVYDAYDNLVDHGVNDYDGLHTIDFTHTATASPNATSPVIPASI
ncbi:unnamed protein product, partial [marine sediment metagenome]